MKKDALRLQSQGYYSTKANGRHAMSGKVESIPESTRSLFHETKDAIFLHIVKEHAKEENHKYVPQPSKQNVF